LRPSKSPYASPGILVPKRDGGFRLVVDYRKVNAKVVFDSYPMLTIDQALDQFSGASVFSVLDLKLAYYQIHSLSGAAELPRFAPRSGCSSSTNCSWALV